MTIEQLFELVKSKWPTEIDISGAELDRENRFSCWPLFAAYEAIEDRADGAEGIVQAALWPFHQALSKVAQTGFASGSCSISTDTVRVDDFASYLKVNLEHPSWSEELEVFLRDNPST